MRKFKRQNCKTFRHLKATITITKHDFFSSLDFVACYFVSTGRKLRNLRLGVDALICVTVLSAGGKLTYTNISLDNCIDFILFFYP